MRKSTSAVEAHAVPTRAEIARRLEALWPELESRCQRMCRRCHDPEETAGELMAFMAVDFVNSAKRGHWLGGAALAFFAARRLRVARQLCGNAARDALSPVARCMGRSNIVSLDALNDPEARMPPRLTQRLTEALASDERESPAELARMRIDWGAFTQKQDRRSRTILTGLAEGRQKKELARRLGVSGSRLTQLLDTLGRDVLGFYPDLASDFQVGAGRQCRARLHRRPMPMAIAGC
jgi:hypothetical protein